MKERIKKNKKFRIKLIILMIAIVLLLAASVYTVFIKPNLSTETYVYKEETVKYGDLILGIMESGSLTLGESSVKYELELDFDDEDSDEDEEDEEADEVKYLEIEEVFVVSGQRISEGDELFSFTQDSVKSVRRRLNAALAEAQIALSEAQTDYNISLISAQSTYDSSVIAGQRAETDYQAALTGSAERINNLEGQIKLLELEITQAQEMLADEDLLDSYEDAKTAYTQAKNIYEDTDLHNATAYTSNLSDYQEAEKQLEQIEEEVQGYQETIIDNQTEIEKIREEIEQAKKNQVLENQQARNTYESAKLEGELAEDIYNYSTESLSNAVTQAQTDLDEIQSLVDKFEDFVGEDNIIYAKEAGLVVNVVYEAGDELEVTGVMLSYATEDNYTVSIDVSEEDIAAVKIGDQVDIVFTAYPDQTWTGTINSITTTATADHSSTISYPIDIQVEGDTSLLYGGMTADVTFVTDSATNVLYVSKKAVFEEDGVTYVYRQAANGDMEKTEVETGFSDMSSIEIVSGLEEGDIVYIKSIINTSEAGNSGFKETSNIDSDEENTEDFPFEGGQMPDENREIPERDENFSGGNGAGPGNMGGMP